MLWSDMSVLCVTFEIPNRISLIILTISRTDLLIKLISN